MFMLKKYHCINRQTKGLLPTDITELETQEDAMERGRQKNRQEEESCTHKDLTPNANH